MEESIEEIAQLIIPKNFGLTERLDASLWAGSFSDRESSLQQLSPYIGKMKSGMAKVLIYSYSKKNDIILDPFSGSGVIPFEAALAGRQAWANDLSPYAYVVSQGKMEAPKTAKIAYLKASFLADRVERESNGIDLSDVPIWVQEFFHPDTLREVISAFQILTDQRDYFLMACLLGILHHVRPGFLSHPASHLVPYLRTSKYPRDTYPDMYKYRDLRSRLLAKVKRAYRRPLLSENWTHRQYKVWNENAMKLPIENAEVDTIISSPPYFGALDYARDNRLRLWFLNCRDWKELDNRLTSKNRSYLSQMTLCIREMNRVLKPGGNCVLVLGDVEVNGKIQHCAEIVGNLAEKESHGSLIIGNIYDDRIPEERRSRRKTQMTKFEKILIMHKI